MPASSCDWLILLLLYYSSSTRTTRALSPHPGHLQYETVIARELEVEAKALVSHENVVEGGLLSNEHTEVAIVVDATCEYLGCAFVNELEGLGIAVVQVLSDYLARGLAWEYGQDPPSQLLAPAAGQEEEWWTATRRNSQNQECRLLFCFSESEAGIPTAERLGAKLGARFSNPISPLRRHKWLLHETLRKAGISHCKQRLCESIEELRDFYASLNQKDVVVKPVRGVGSDGVRICKTLEETEAAFRHLQSIKRYGSDITNTHVLIQARLLGPEYAVDTVSRDGEHKVVAVWLYDKRNIAIDAPRVYFCTELVSKFPESISKAVLTALDATGHTDGPTHTEVILTSSRDEPIVVEINARFHNTDFTMVTQPCLNLTQIRAAAVAASGNDALWHQLPDRPLPFEGAGRIVHLVSYSQGRIQTFNDTLYQEFLALPSLVAADIYATEPGQLIKRTVDITTDAGTIFLTSDDKAQVDADYNFILENMKFLYPSVLDDETLSSSAHTDDEDGGSAHVSTTTDDGS